MKKLGRNVLMLVVPAICGLVSGTVISPVVYLILLLLGGNVQVANKQNKNRFATYLWLASVVAYLYGALLSATTTMFGLGMEFKFILYVSSFIFIYVFLKRTNTKGVPFINVPVFLAKWIGQRNEEYFQKLK